TRMNRSVRSDRANLAVTKRRKIISLEPYSAVFEKLIKKISAEDEFGALNLDGEVSEHRDQEIDSETDVEDNPICEQYSDSNSHTNACIIHPFN
ncbi:hypothetical protein AVEN_118958-1, partial [Araneus ventricosus]